MHTEEEEDVGRVSKEATLAEARCVVGRAQIPCHFGESVECAVLDGDGQIFRTSV